MVHIASGAWKQLERGSNITIEQTALPLHPGQPGYHGSHSDDKVILTAHTLNVT